MQSQRYQSVRTLALVWLCAAFLFSACNPTTPQKMQEPTPSIEPTTIKTLSSQESPTNTLLPTPSETTLPSPSSALLIIEFSPIDRAIRQVPITEPINGVEALQATGLEIVTADFGDSGVAVCSIGGIGCPADNCFCSTKFWSYEGWADEVWQPYQTGPSDVTVAPGAIEGWRWAELGDIGLPPAPALVSAARAYKWMQQQQDRQSGGYDSPSSSLEVLLAIGANKLLADQWSATEDSLSLGDYWQSNAQTYATDGVANAGKLSAALSATGTCWPAGTIEPSSYYTGTNGQYSPHAGFQAWGILGSLAISQTVSVEAVEFLKNLAQPDGGWEWNQGFGSDTNTTALIIQSLIAAGEPPDSPIISNALNYLKSAQNADGGFTYSPTSQFGTDSDVNSTSYVVQSILAAGQSPISSIWTISETNPIEYLLGMQLVNGSFEWQKGSGENLTATAQAATALLGIPYPIRIAGVPSCP